MVLQQNYAPDRPLSQMVLSQNYAQMGMELMPQALHSTTGMGPSNTQILQQNSIPDQFNLTGSFGNEISPWPS